jgi:arylsulfatase A-like enzyme
MWGPGRIPAGTSTDAVVSTIDLLPTIAALCGEPLRSDRRIDGLDASATWTSDESPREEFVFYSAQGLLEGIRIGNWKLLERGGRGKDAKNEQYLFNLASDLGEQNNRFDEQPEVVARLRARMTEIDAEITENARPVWRKEAEK